jgi:G8 domain
VYVDKTFTGAKAFGAITISSGGILYFPDNQPLMFSTSGILVESGGGLRIGTPICPTGNHAITDQVVLNFTGNPPQPSIPKGITVKSGGSLSMYGEKGTPLNQYGVDPSWTYLAASAGPATPGAKVPVPAGGATTIQVAGQLDWQQNDWIVIAPTDFTPDGGEFVQIAAAPIYNATTNITSIQLVQSLTDYHFGGPAPDDTLDPNCKDADGNPLPASFCETATQNYGVDERAEVGLVTRSIKLTSLQTDLPFWWPGHTYATNQIIQGQALSSGATPVITTYAFKATSVNGNSGANPPNFPNNMGDTVVDGGVTWTNMGPIDQHWGGEISVADGATFQMEGVEIENFGKDLVGSYPLSVTGATTAPANHTNDGDIAFNTIHHSFNHGIVLSTAGSHSPNGLKINGNLIARAVGHLYDLADGSATAIGFNHDLGVGAMEYSFSTCNVANNQSQSCNLTAGQFAARLDKFWLGDNLAEVIGYDGYNIPFTDPTTGTYAQAPASGFYITNISATLTGNSIAGCQGNGNGVLYLPAQPVQTGPVGTFLNNRLHGCYVGLDASYGLSPGYSFNLNNIQPKDASNLDQLTTFNGLTATRNRYFGAWMRPNYFVVDNSRFATNRESISLVSGGGPESSPSGEWGLLENSVVVGESQNNPSRWGPCPITPTANPASVWGNDGLHGCVGDDYGGRGFPQPYWNEYGYMFYDGPARLENDRMVNFLQDIAGIGRTTPAIQTACTAATPGPGELTDADASFLCAYSNSATMPGANINNSTGVSNPFVYEGDAAFGWFQSNVNNYPPTQYSEHMIFENVDLRHQVYTQEVNQGPFVDGDKGTVILDNDGSLTGYCVIDSTGADIPNKHAISLNNIPFLGTPNSVDECEATGPQDEVFEGRASSLISPQDYGTLEINALTQPPVSNLFVNQVYITKDQKDYVGVQQYDVDNLGTKTADNPQGLELVPCATDHSCLSLAGRNGTGSYEPKVINGLGYTMQSSKGFPSFIDLGLVDASVSREINQRAVADASITTGTNLLTSASANFVATDIGSGVIVAGAGSGPNSDLAATITGVSGNVATLSGNATTTVSSAAATITRAFSIRLGICYKTASGTAPSSASDFAVMLGRKSWSNTGGTLPLIMPYFYIQLPTCQGLDFSNPGNLLTCPAPPAGGSVQALTGIDVTGGAPLPAVLDPNAFYYDATNGLLFIQVQQTEPNAIGASPLGTPGCSGSTSAPCLDPSAGESLYSCPADGCGLYTIDAAGGYAPSGPTACAPYGGATDYSQAYPPNMNQLEFMIGSKTGQSVQPFIMQEDGMSFPTHLGSPATQQFPHNIDTNSNGTCNFN